MTFRYPMDTIYTPLPPPPPRDVLEGGGRGRGGLKGGGGGLAGTPAVYGPSTASLPPPPSHGLTVPKTLDPPSPEYMRPSPSHSSADTAARRTARRAARDRRATAAGCARRDPNREVRTRSHESEARSGGSRRVCRREPETWAQGSRRRGGGGGGGQKFGAPKMARVSDDGHFGLVGGGSGGGGWTSLKKQTNANQR